MPELPSPAERTPSASALRPSIPPPPKSARALGAVRAALVLAGAVLGWGAASAVMTYGGGHPVNVWDFLLAFVGVQLALLALLVALFVLPLAATGAPVAGPLRRAVGWATGGRRGPSRALRPSVSGRQSAGGLRSPAVVATRPACGGRATG